MKPTIELEEVDCPLCESPERTPIHREGSFQMVKCTSCQFIYLNPRPTNEALHEFYQRYLPEEERSIESWQKMMGPVFKRAAHLLKRFRGTGRLIDVGTGFGFFLSEMKKRGWEVTGVEISQRGMNYARDRLAVNVYPGPLEKAGFPEEHFDAVTAFYVIEHLPNPIPFLKECHRILKTGGLLLLRYPHTTPIKNLFRLLGVENRLYDLPAHLADFSPQTIQRLIERAGFDSCKHLIGGYTYPDSPGKRLSSSFFGNLSEVLFYLSGKKFLFPGVSKTVLGFKKGSGSVRREGSIGASDSFSKKVTFTEVT
jgi:2-polyprenyl-3-methyl-5-hydroxy-6-metoxy-1,4-benzoquinol methylase